MSRSRLYRYGIGIASAGLLLFLALGLARIHGAMQALRSSGIISSEGSGQRALFEGVLRRIRLFHVDPHEDRELLRAAIHGMLGEIGDPHASLLSAGDYESLRLDTEGEYGGLGIELGERSGRPTVIRVMPNTPAAVAGIWAGDHIVKIEDQETSGMGLQEVVDRLRGSVGEKVALTVQHAGDSAAVPVALTRAKIHTSSVPAVYLSEDSIGYIELVTFAERSGAEVRDAIRELRSKGMHGLILDLRSNPGGLLDAGQDVAELFLPRGETIATLLGRDPGQKSVLRASSGSEIADLPLVVLIGPHSASAAEIVAGALQDHDRAIIIGNRSFGKGSVQTVFPMANDHWLKITTGRWYTPSGRSIQAVTGSEPDTFRTTSGRPVLGGGGINPDIVVDPASVVGAVALREHLGDQWAPFRDLLYTEAVIMSRGSALSPAFRLGTSDLRRIQQRLSNAGIPIPDNVFALASDWIRTEVESEIALARWGHGVLRERLNRSDPAVTSARSLLRGVHTQRDLLERIRASLRPTPSESL